MNVQDLPDELSCMIAGYLKRKDLHNYRLTSKHFARIGTALFEVFDFGGCTDDRTLARVTAIASTPLARHVRTLRYYQALGQRFRYHHNEPDTLGTYPCEILYKVARDFYQAGSNLTTLWTDSLRFEFFTSAAHVNALARACLNVKTMHLEFDTPLSHHPKRGGMVLSENNIRAFLPRLQHLENLCLVFLTTGLLTHQHRLCDLIPITHKWAHLRDLTIHAVFATAADLVAVMANHADSLTSMRFTGAEICDPKALGGQDPVLDGSGEDTPEDWRAIFEQVGRMNLKQGYISEPRGWPFTRYGEQEEGLLGWIVDCENGKEVFIDTNLGQYLEDDDEGDFDYDSDNGEDTEDDDEDKSDDSEFWSDDGEYWQADKEFFALDSEILPGWMDQGTADADDTDDSGGETKVHEA